MPPMYEPIREPLCIHSEGTQPASMCRICKDGQALADWRAYWASPEGQERKRRLTPILTRR